MVYISYNLIEFLFLQKFVTVNIEFIFLFFHKFHMKTVKSIEGFKHIQKSCPFIDE